MTTVSIFGTGNMGTAIGDLLAAGGASVQHVTRDPNEPITGDIVVLAVPFEALDDIVARYRDQLAGRTVVDITNPLNFDTFAELKVPAGSSAAAGLQAALGVVVSRSCRWAVVVLVPDKGDAVHDLGMGVATHQRASHHHLPSPGFNPGRAGSVIRCRRTGRQFPGAR